MLSPPLSPPHMNRGPQRSVAKSSSLKLITSFGDRNAKSKFFSAGDAATPIAAGPTPIAESAQRSAGGLGEPATAVLRPAASSPFQTPASALPRGGFNRARLPSIGEQPSESRPSDLVQSEDPSGEDDDSQFSLKFSDIVRSKTSSPGMMRTRRETHNDRLVTGDAPPPSPSPQSLAALMAHNKNERNGSRHRIPGGRDLQLSSSNKQPSVGDITSPEPSATSSAAGTRYHWPSRRRGPGSVASSVTSAGSSVARSHHGRERNYHHTAKTLDDYINNLDAANKHRGRPSSSGRERQSSHPRKPASREVSQQSRGRTSSRGKDTPRGGPKRSPTSPVPMSPEDLITLTTPNETVDDKLSGRFLVDTAYGEQAPPSTVKKAAQHTRRESSRSRTRESSQTRSQTGRDRSASRRPPALDLRGRTNVREGSTTGSVRRSPTSPVPMSADFGSGSDDDYKRALEAKEKFRTRRLTGRSSSRNANDPASPASVRSRNHSFASMESGSPVVPRARGLQSPAVAGRGHFTFDAASVKSSRTRDRSRSRTSNSSRKMDAPMPTPQPMQLAADSDSKPMQTEVKTLRQLKKEAAARELEERRRSLATRALAPPIMHPNELFPVQGSTFVLPKDLPTRSQTASPGASRSTQASRGLHIGLPATPKAMRLVIDPDHKDAPMPPIPTTFAQAASPESYGPSPVKVSPKKASPVEPSSLAQLTLLPATVYTPPPPRSASAPPVEPTVPDMLRSGSAMNTRGLPQRVRKGSVGEGSSGRRPSYDNNNNNKTPPPPPPAPTPMLKELAHLAMPPPPPPAPMAYAANKPVVYGGKASGMIEIVMDDDAPAQPAVPVAAPVSDAQVPIIAPPAPPSSRNGHRRGRSSVDNSIAGRISRATERMRSASRSRGNVTPGMARTKSPEGTAAPYESVPLPPPPMSFQARAEMRSPPPVQGDFRTGLHESEMI